MEHFETNVQIAGTRFIARTVALGEDKPSLRLNNLARPFQRLRNLSRQ